MIDCNSQNSDLSSRVTKMDEQKLNQSVQFALQNGYDFISIGHTHPNIPEEERAIHKNKEIGKSLKYFDDNEILQLWNLGFTYSEISKKLNCSVDTIRRALDRQKINKEIRKERIRIQQSLNPKSCNKKKVIQYSLEGQYIQTFLSMAEANRYLNLPVNNSNISQVCKGKRKTAYGHKWKYAD